MSGQTKLVDVLKQLPDTLQEQLAGIRAHEDDVLRALRKPETRDLFLEDPVAALTAMGIAVSEELKEHLRSADPTVTQLQKLIPYELSNGKVVHARVNVRFTKEA